MKARRTPGVAWPRTPGWRSRGLEPPHAKAKGSECRNERKPDRRRRRQGVKRPAAGCGESREKARGRATPATRTVSPDAPFPSEPDLPVGERHDPTGEPSAGNRHAGFGERGAETWLGTRVSEAPTDGESRRNQPKTATASCYGARVAPRLYSLFAFGIDPDSSALPSDKPGDWPSLAETRPYCRRVRETVDSVFETVSPDGANACIEHQLMHAETVC